MFGGAGLGPGMAGGMPLGGPLRTGLGPRAEQEADMQDAMAYLHRVSQEFGDRPDIYRAFLTIIQQMKDHDIDRNEVLSRVSQLFRGHDELVLGFQMFFAGSGPPDPSPVGPPAVAGQTTSPPLDPRAPPPSSATEEVQMNDAVAYMDRVRKTFANRPEAFQEFLDIVKGFQDGRIDTAGVVAGVSRLFRGHEELLQGFNAFLPEGQSMPVAGGSSSSGRSALRHGSGGDLAAVGDLSAGPGIAPPPVAAQGPPGGTVGGRLGAGLQMTDAVAYMDRLRETFTDQQEVYFEFVEIMRSFQNDEISIEGVIEHVCRLFAGHEDLLQGFNLFLPDGHVMPGAPVAPCTQGPAGVAPPAIAGGPPSTMLTPEVPIPPRGKPEQDPELMDAMGYMQRVRELFSGELQGTYDRFLDVMRQFQSGRLDTPGVMSEVSQLFAGYPEMIHGFNTFLPEGHRMPSAPNAMASKADPPSSLPPPAMGVPPAVPPPVTGISPVVDPFRGPKSEAPYFRSPPPPPLHSPATDVAGAVNFVTEVRRRFANDPEVYRRFLEALQAFESGRQDKHHLLRTVAELFHGHPDLLSEVGRYLTTEPRLPDVPSPLGQGLVGPAHPHPHLSRQHLPPHLPSDLPQDMDNAVSFLNQVKERFGDTLTYRDFLALLQDYERGVLKQDQVIRQVEKLLVGHPDLIQQFTYFMPNPQTPPLSLAPNNPEELPAGPTSPIEEDNQQFAINFVNRVKERFSGEPEKYSLFMTALQEYESNQSNQHWNKTIFDVARQLFGDHPDLLRDFSYFLPHNQEQPIPAQQFTEALEQAGGSRSTEMDEDEEEDEAEEEDEYPPDVPPGPPDERAAPNGPERERRQSWEEEEDEEDEEEEEEEEEPGETEEDRREEAGSTITGQARAPPTAKEEPEDVYKGESAGKVGADGEEGAHDEGAVEAQEMQNSPDVRENGGATPPSSGDDDNGLHDGEEEESRRGGTVAEKKQSGDAEAEGSPTLTMDDDDDAIEEGEIEEGEIKETETKDRDAERRTSPIPDVAGGPAEDIENKSAPGNDGQITNGACGRKRPISTTSEDAGGEGGSCESSYGFANGPSEKRARQESMNMLNGSEERLLKSSSQHGS